MTRKRPLAPGDEGNKDDSIEQDILQKSSEGENHNAGFTGLVSMFSLEK